MKNNLSIALIFLIVLTAAACTPVQSEAVQTVETYLTALVEKDEDRLISLSCPDWEMNALLELDALQAVETRLEGVACSQTGGEGDRAEVNCSGKIVASYGEEDQEFDLSTRYYEVVNNGDAWLVCGY